MKFVLLFCLLTAVLVNATGGWHQIDLKNGDESELAGVSNAANFAVTTISDQQNTRFVLVRITAAYSQIVAGVNYRLIIDLLANGHTLTHTVVVWDQFGDLTLTSDQIGAIPPSFKSHATRTLEKLVPVMPPSPIPQIDDPHQLIGGWTEINLNTANGETIARVVSVAEYSVAEINSKSNSIDPFTFRRLVEAAEQIVAGIKYRLLIELDWQNTVVEHRVVVWDHFGDRKLISDEPIPAPN